MGPCARAIDEEHCLELLKGVEYGRVAVVTREGCPGVRPTAMAPRPLPPLFCMPPRQDQTWRCDVAHHWRGTPVQPLGDGPQP